MPSKAAPVLARTRAEIIAEAKTLTGRTSLTPAAIESGDTGEGSAEAGTSVGELWLYGVVGGWWRGFDAESVKEALRGLDVDELIVRIHSPGGYASDGIAIGNLLRNHRAKVTTVVDGLAASAASVIAIAGETVVMCPGSQLMIHDAMVGTYGNAAELRTIAEYIDSQSANYAGVYAHRGGGTPESWREQMLANDGLGTFFTAQGTVDAGLADEVGTRVAVSSPPTAPEDDDWWDDDDMLARAEHDLQLLDQCVHPAARAAWSGTQPAPPKAQPAPKPPTASAGGKTQPEGAAVVDFNDTQIAAMREQVGFPADADADTIVAAVTEALAENADPKVTTQVPEGMKLVSATVLDDVTAKAERGAKAALELRDMRVAAALDTYKDRFDASDEAKAKWKGDLERDYDSTVAYLKAAAVLVPTGEQGHGGDGENQPTAVKDDPNYQKWSF